MTIKESPIKGVPVIKIYRNQWLSTKDKLAIEEPLEIRLAFGTGLNRTVKNISVTMRTPGSDAELATGFLFTEGIIKDKNDLSAVEHCFIACAENKENVIQVELRETAAPELKNTERNFYTTSSCGVCGKGSIDSIKSVSAFHPGQNKDFFITGEMMRELPDRLRLYQDIFDVTGGLHACALFDTNGELLLLREDVGRHNALDKLVGAALDRDWLPLKNAVLLLSGRASFELVQKAAMAGISIIGAIGAPSSLAVQLAEEFGITLVGFLRQQRFNIYTGEERILLSGNENQD
jgi:FdhD protein